MVVVITVVVVISVVFYLFLSFQIVDCCFSFVSFFARRIETNIEFKTVDDTDDYVEPA